MLHNWQPIRLKMVYDAFDGGDADRSAPLATFPRQTCPRVVPARVPRRLATGEHQCDPGGASRKIWVRNV